MILPESAPVSSPLVNKSILKMYIMKNSCNMDWLARNNLLAYKHIYKYSAIDFTN